MDLVPRREDTTMISPEVYWDKDPRAVHVGKTEGDVEKERKVVERIKELGLLEHKLHMERQLMTRLEDLMLKKDALYTALNQFRRKRPLKERLNHTLSEIRNLIHPSITRDSFGRKLDYTVRVLMGFFTTNVKYRADKSTKIVVVYGETADDEEKLTKEVVLEFPMNVDMSRVDAEYSAGVFKVSIPFTSNLQCSTSSDDHSLLSCGESGSLPSLDEQSMASSDDVRTDLVSPGSEMLSPGSDMVSPGSEMLSPGSEIHSPGSETMDTEETSADNSHDSAVWV